MARVVSEVTLQYLSDGTWRMKSANTPLEQLASVSNLDLEKLGINAKNKSIDLMVLGSSTGRCLSVVKEICVQLGKELETRTQMDEEAFYIMVKTEFPRVLEETAKFYSTSSASLRSTLNVYFFDGDGRKVTAKEFRTQVADYVWNLHRGTIKDKHKLQLLFESTLDVKQYTDRVKEYKAVGLFFKNGANVRLLLGDKSL